VVVLQEVYQSEESERGIERACEHLVRTAGIRLIGVENLDADYGLDLPASSERDWSPHARNALSPGVFWFLRRNERPCRVVGIDDGALRGPAEVARRALAGEAERRERAFLALVEIAREAEQQTYDARILPAFPVLEAKWERGSLGVQVEGIKTAASRLGIDPESFPQLTKFDTAFGLERRLFGKGAGGGWQVEVERERKAFLQRLIGAVNGWLERNANEVRYDPKAARRCLRFWAGLQRAESSELEAQMKTRGVGEVLMQCHVGLNDWLLANAVRVRTGAVGASHLYREFLKLALCLEVDLTDLRLLREYAAYTRLADEIDAGTLLLELAEARHRIVEAGGGPKALELLALERQLRELRRALACEVSPDDAEVSPAEPGALTAAADRLFDHVGRECDGRLREDIALLDRSLAHAQVWATANLERSLAMATNVVRHLRRHRDDRMLVVAGGFHARNITRMLERHRNLSTWGVSPKLTEVGGYATSTPYLNKVEWTAPQGAGADRGGHRVSSGV
jgi:hypothetical protein